MCENDESIEMFYWDCLNVRQCLKCLNKLMCYEWKAPNLALS